MDIIVSGSRAPAKRMQRHAELIIGSLSPDTTIIQGGASGIDAIAKRVGAEREYEVITVEANWAKFGNRAGHLRNGDMLKHYPEALLIAIWNGESPGTKDMIRQALAERHRNAMIHYANGACSVVHGDTADIAEIEAYGAFAARAMRESALTIAYGEVLEVVEGATHEAEFRNAAEKAYKLLLKSVMPFSRSGDIWVFPSSRSLSLGHTVTGRACTCCDDVPKKPITCWARAARAIITAAERRQGAMQCP